MTSESTQFIGAQLLRMAYGLKPAFADEVLHRTAEALTGDGDPDPATIRALLEQSDPTERDCALLTAMAVVMKAGA